MCGILLAFRRSDQLQNPQFWAEDGSVFFLQAKTLGLEALFTPAAGYFHTALRLVAWFANSVEIALAPAVYVAAAFAFTLYVAARTQSSRFPLPASPLYALAVVLIPDSYEVLLNLTNVQWILAAGLILVLIAREPKTFRGRAHDLAAVLLLGLTGPFVMVLAPLFVWRAFDRRSRFSVILASGASLCAMTQLVAFARDTAAIVPAQVSVELLFSVPGVRVAGSLFTGGELDGEIARLVTSLAGVALLAAIGFLALRKGPARLERIWLGLAFVGLCIVSLYRCRELLPQLLNPGLGGRYFFPLQLLAIWLLITLAHAAKPWARRAGGALLLGALAINFDRLKEPPLIDFDWQYYAAQIRNGEEVIVSTNPVNWEFTVPGHQSTNVTKRVGMPSSGLVNASLRGFVTPSRPACLGFVLQDRRPRKLLVRAVGPSLASFGVAEPLATPTMTLLHNGTEVAGFAPRLASLDHPEIRAACASTGAFALRPDARDLVAVIDLPPGAYSLVVSSGDCSGEALLEVYEVPHCWYPAREHRRSRRKSATE